MGLLLACAFVALTLLPVGTMILEGVNAAIARQEVQDLAEAVAMFLNDTGEVPARLRERSRCLYRATDGTATACARVLFTGIESLVTTGSRRRDLPLLGPKLLGPGETCGYNPRISRLDQRNGRLVPRPCEGTDRVSGWDNIDNHLMHNRRDYPGGWQGPYLSRNSLDPWGNSYLIFVESLWARNQGALLGVVISAGPNGVIETDLTAVTATVSFPSKMVGGDDIMAVVMR
jgi:hypothetical protein